MVVDMSIPTSASAGTSGTSTGTSASGTGKNNKSNVSDIIVVIISIIVVIGLFVILLFTILNKNNHVVTLSLDPCGSQEPCATNIETGQKRCPVNSSEKIYYNPDIEVCNPPDSCISPETPYTILPDGSTCLDDCPSTDGIVSCSPFPVCPNYIQSVFSNTITQYASFGPSQITANGESGGVISSVPPMVIPKDYFCTASFQNLLDSTPGCQYNDTVQTCMQRGTACSRGVLAVIVDNVSSFNPSNPMTLGCVGASPITCDGYTLYDKSTNSLSCK